MLLDIYITNTKSIFIKLIHILGFIFLIKLYSCQFCILDYHQEESVKSWGLAYYTRKIFEDSAISVSQTFLPILFCRYLQQFLQQSQGFSFFHGCSKKYGAKQSCNEKVFVAVFTTPASFLLYGCHIDLILRQYCV